MDGGYADNMPVAMAIADGADEIIAVHAEENRRKDTSPVREEDARVDLGRDARDTGNGPNPFGDRILSGDHVALHRQERDMRLEVEDLLLPDVPEACHHAPDDNHHRDAEHHAEDRDAGDNRSDGSLRFQILQCQEQRETQPLNL